MDFEAEYEVYAKKFAKHLSLDTSKVYIAPGNSAEALVNRLRVIALETNLTLPIIHTLSREHSRNLYWLENNSFKLLEPFVENGELNFLEDYFLTGTKMELMYNALKLQGVMAKFLVMIGGKDHNNSYVSIFDINRNLAEIINRKFNSTRS